MEEKERRPAPQRHGELYIATAERFEHSAIFLHPNPGGVAETLNSSTDSREERFALFLLMHGDPTFSIPDGAGMLEFATRLAEDRTESNAKPPSGLPMH